MYWFPFWAAEKGGGVGVGDELRLIIKVSAYQAFPPGYLCWTAYVLGEFKQKKMLPSRNSVIEQKKPVRPRSWS